MRTSIKAALKEMQWRLKPPTFVMRHAPLQRGRPRPKDGVAISTCCGCAR
jgi:hypothetical protein